MADHFPQRPQVHQMADESIGFLARHIPRGWTFDQPQHDYGIDVRIGLAERGQLNGQQLVVQLKSSAQANAGDTVSLRLGVPTLNLLRNMREVAMLVKFVAAE